MFHCLRTFAWAGRGWRHATVSLRCTLHCASAKSAMHYTLHRRTTWGDVRARRQPDILPARGDVDGVLACVVTNGGLQTWGKAQDKRRESGTTSECKHRSADRDRHVEGLPVLDRPTFTLGDRGEFIGFFPFFFLGGMRLCRALRGCCCGSRGFLEYRMMDIQCTLRTAHHTACVRLAVAFEHRGEWSCPKTMPKLPCRVAVRERAGPCLRAATRGSSFPGGFIGMAPKIVAASQDSPKRPGIRC